jgi:chaperonin GroES
MLKALEDRIIIKVDKKDETVSASGLIIQAQQEIEKIGIVVAVGPGRVLPNGVRLDPDVTVGDKIVFNPMATMKLDYDGQEYLSIFSRDLVAIIEGE